MDRGEVVGGESTAKVLSNNVIKDVKAVKNDKVYQLDPKLWYFCFWFNYNNYETN